MEGIMNRQYDYHCTGAGNLSIVTYTDDGGDPVFLSVHPTFEVAKARATELRLAYLAGLAMDAIADTMANPNRTSDQILATLDTIGEYTSALNTILYDRGESSWQRREKEDAKAAASLRFASVSDAREAREILLATRQAAAEVSTAADGD
jgi:hypothetical protein